MTLDIKKIKQIIIFTIVFVFGIVLHSLAFADYVFNFDSLNRMYGIGALPRLGRFMGYILEQWFGNYFGYEKVIPLINIFLSVVFISLANSILAQIFEIKNIFISIIIGLLIMMSPAISDTMQYHYVAYWYAFNLLINFLACYLLLKRNQVILPFLLLTVSLAIYQAYFLTSITIIFLYYYQEALNHSSGASTNNSKACFEDLKEYFLKIIKCIVVVVASLCTYINLNKIYLTWHGIKMAAYNGMTGNVVPKYTAIELINLVKKTYIILAEYITSNIYSISNTYLISILLIPFYLLFVIIIIKKIKRLDLPYIVVSAILTLLLPIIINAPVFVTSSLADRVALNFVFLFITPLLLLDKLIIEEGQAYGVGTSALIKILHVSTCALAIIFIINFANTGVGEYYSLKYANKEMENITLDISNRIYQLDDYDKDKKVIFVGKLNVGALNQDRLENEELGFISMNLSYNPLNVFHRYSPFEFKYYTYDDVELLTLDSKPSNREARTKKDFYAYEINSTLFVVHSSLDEVAAMPSYPRSGCVKVVGDKVIVKFSD